MRVVNKWNLGLCEFADKGEVGKRYGLTLVRIGASDTVATDGRSLVKVDLVEIPDDVPEAVVKGLTVFSGTGEESSSETPFLIDSKLADRLEARVSRCKRSPVDKDEIVPGVAYVGTDQETESPRVAFFIPGEDKGTLDRITTTTASGTYPDIEKVIPKAKPYATVDVNGKMLGKILSFLGRFAEYDSGRVTLSLHREVDGDGAGILKVKARNKNTGQNAVAVIMPFAPRGEGE